MSYPVSPLVNQLKSINQPQIIQSVGQSLDSRVSQSANQPAINHSVSWLVPREYQSYLVMQSASHKLFSQLVSRQTVETDHIQSISQRYICKSLSVMVSPWTVESVSLTQYFSESMYYTVNPQSISQSINQPQISKVSYSDCQSTSYIIIQWVDQFSDSRVSYSVSQMALQTVQPQICKSFSVLLSSRSVESVTQCYFE